MSSASCKDGELENCRDESTALILKLVAIASILIAGVVGIAIPLVGRNRRFLRTDGNVFVAAKAFAAGVILATGFVHMLPGGSEALSDPCLPEYPWSKFPFSGFFAMVASLVTLFVDFVGTQYYERKQRVIEEKIRVGSEDPALESGIVTGLDANGGKVFGEEEGGGIHIVGMHAHAAHHRHSHPHGQDACDGYVSDHGHGHGHGNGHGHGHSHGIDDDEEDGGVRHVVVSQVCVGLVFCFTVFLFGCSLVILN